MKKAMDDALAYHACCILFSPLWLNEFYYYCNIMLHMWFACANSCLLITLTFYAYYAMILRIDEKTMNSPCDQNGQSRVFFIVISLKLPD